jgi:hypothetical protein
MPAAGRRNRVVILALPMMLWAFCGAASIGLAWTIAPLEQTDSASQSRTDDPLTGLRHGHPRLVVLDSDIGRLRSLIRQDAKARRVYLELAELARQMETEPVVEPQPAGRQLLRQSRQCLERVYTLALLYRLDGNRRYLERAVKELRAMAVLPDWNPHHFLDTAEMTHAMAIGYDWLFDVLSPEDRALMQRAIRENGLKASLPFYQLPPNSPRGPGGSNWHLWAQNINNWGLVCNGGMTLGALAIGDEDAQIGRTILRYAERSIRKPLREIYSPEGGSGEGPGYWHYATYYTACLVSGLESALGQDWQIPASQGLAQTGRFRIYISSPRGWTFNYGDSHPEVGRTQEMFWLAKLFKQPVYAWHEQCQLESEDLPEVGPRALDLIWYTSEAQSPQQAKWPLGAVFHGVEVATMRSAWGDPNAIWVAAKGGDCRFGHSHRDLGGFVMDAGHVRWALDPGRMRSRTLFDEAKGVRNESAMLHNTLLIDGEDQDRLLSKAAIVDEGFRPEFQFVRIDLSQTYPGKLERLERGVALYQLQHVLVQDELSAEHPVEAVWGMLTEAQVSVQGPVAELKQGGWRLTAQILAPQGARFDVLAPASTQPAAAIRKLLVRLPTKVSDLRLVVALSPHPEGTTAPKLSWRNRRLDQW